MTSPVLEVRGISKSFDGTRPIVALRSLSLVLRKGAFLTLLGPSGCGKTTLLRIMAGLTEPTEGHIFVDGVERSPLGDAMLLFQEYGRSLLPWRSVSGNVMLALENRNVPLSERADRAQQAISLVGLQGFEHAHPRELSGGMQQRVALARALVREPKVLLMDEPFGSLDAETREHLEDLLLRIWGERSLSIVLVTHDLDEALYLADEIVLLTARPGRVEHELRAGLPYPRSQVSTKEHPEYLATRRKLYVALRGNSVGA